MKVKQRPEDFRVEEVSRLEAGADGEFALYRLSKGGIGTPEAVRVVARSWRLRPQDVSFAGLKDRHGLTAQMVTVRRGPKRNFEGRGFKLNFLGRSPRPAGRGTILKNRFRIVLRDLGPDQGRKVRERAASAAEHGFPDYYDDQRFGSLRGTGGRFVASALLAGNAEEALRLAIASPARADRSRTKRRRRLLRDSWGEWEELARRLDPSVERRIASRLAAGASFVEAYGLLDPALRSLHLAAFQAHLFNECVRRIVGEGPSHPGASGPYVFPERPPDGRVPLASGAAPPDPVLDAVLADGGLDRERLSRLPFHEASRGLLALPQDLEAGEAAEDELNPGREKMELAFDLRSGSYATMLIKRCTYDMK